MPEYYQYEIAIPKDSHNLASALYNLKTSKVQTSFQTNLLSKSLDLIEQRRLYSDNDFRSTVAARDAKNITKSIEELDLESIYGKAEALGRNSPDIKDKIAQKHKYQSYADANRIDTIKLNIDGKELVIKNAAKNALTYHNQKYASSEQNTCTMDMIVDYLQDNYKVEVSEAQRHYLRTQWNQMSDIGSDTPLYSTVREDGSFTCVDSKDSNHTFVIENAKLVAMEYVTLVKNKVRKDDDIILDGNSGVSSVRADLNGDEFQGQKSQSNPQNLITADWLPKNAAQISIKYRSDNLSLNLEEELVNILKEHGAEVKKESFYSKVLNFLLVKFSQFKEIIKTTFFNTKESTLPITNHQEIITSQQEKSVQEASKLKPPIIINTDIVDHPRHTPHTANNPKQNTII
jgi:hypothetical protein